MSQIGQKRTFKLNKFPFFYQIAHFESRFLIEVNRLEFVAVDGLWFSQTPQ